MVFDLLLPSILFFLQHFNLQRVSSGFNLGLMCYIMRKQHHDTPCNSSRVNQPALQSTVGRLSNFLVWLEDERRDWDAFNVGAPSQVSPNYLHSVHLWRIKKWKAKKLRFDVNFSRYISSSLHVSFVNDDVVVHDWLYAGNCQCQWRSYLFWFFPLSYLILFRVSLVFAQI